MPGAEYLTFREGDVFTELQSPVAAGAGEAVQMEDAVEYALHQRTLWHPKLALGAVRLSAVIGEGLLAINNRAEA